MLFRDDDFQKIVDEDEQMYVGDLDSLIAGVCDYLSRSTEKPGKNNFNPSPLFEQAPEIAPIIPIVIQDDSQIKIIKAEKLVAKKISYIVEIESI